MQVQFERADLFSEITYSAPHVIAAGPAGAAVTLHGGFDASGAYVPPRSAGRVQAMANWEAQLKARGGTVFAASSALLTGPRVPNVAQQRLLLREGLGRTFWTGLTVTGKIEGRGRLLAEIPLPDLQSLVVEDISGMALGHLDRGLLEAHGIDEGGEPERGIGGHDVMWFAARDLVFGPAAYPDVEPPDNIARPEAGTRLLPRLAPQYEGLLSLLMNLLIIEFRAEIGFANTQEVLRTADLFAGRRAEAELAAQLIERIRTDELIHVDSLRLYLGELWSVTLRTVDGGTVAGGELLTPYWEGLVRWATVEQPVLAAVAADQVVRQRIVDDAPTPAVADRVLAAYAELSDLEHAASSAG